MNVSLALLPQRIQYGLGSVYSPLIKCKIKKWEKRSVQVVVRYSFYYITPNSIFFFKVSHNTSLFECRNALCQSSQCVKGRCAG